MYVHWQASIYKLKCIIFLLQNACQILLGRLEPYMNANPKGSWEDWVCLNIYA